MPTTEKQVTIDFGQVNLKSLVLTTDVNLYEQIKAQGNIGILFEPIVVADIGLENSMNFYLVGIQKDK